LKNSTGTLIGDQKSEIISSVKTTQESINYTVIDESESDTESKLNSNENSLITAIGINILKNEDTSHKNNDQKTNNNGSQYDTGVHSGLNSINQFNPIIMEEDKNSNMLLNDNKKDLKLNSNLFEKIVKKQIHNQIENQAYKRQNVNIFEPIGRSVQVKNFKVNTLVLLKNYICLSIAEYPQTHNYRIRLASRL